jgi:hypothetical protein
LEVALQRRTRHAVQRSSSRKTRYAFFLNRLYRYINSALSLRRQRLSWRRHCCGHGRDASIFGGAAGLVVEHVNLSDALVTIKVHLQAPLACSRIPVHEQDTRAEYMSGLTLRLRIIIPFEHGQP